MQRAIFILISGLPSRDLLNRVVQRSTLHRDIAELIFLLLFKLLKTLRVLTFGYEVSTHISALLEPIPTLKVSNSDLTPPDSTSAQHKSTTSITTPCQAIASQLNGSIALVSSTISTTMSSPTKDEEQLPSDVAVSAAVPKGSPPAQPASTPVPRTPEEQQQLDEFNQWLFRWNNYQHQLAHYWRGRGAGHPSGSSNTAYGTVHYDKWQMRFQELCDFKVGVWCWSFVISLVSVDILLTIAIRFYQLARNGAL